MRIGLVCPYDLGRPGGVQGQVLGLAEELLRRGHQVTVLGPGHPPGAALPHVTSAGAARAVRGNGSVAHLAVGPSVPGRVERWLARERPQVVHVHEPATPGLGVSAVRRTRAAGLPVVATFHAARPVGRTARASGPLVRAVLGPLAVATAVSQEARQVVLEQYHLDPLVVPNGLDVAGLAGAPLHVEPPAGRPVVLFIGRRDEPRKGLPVLAAARARLEQLVPDVQIVLVGPGRAGLPGALDLGEVSESEKWALLRRADVLVAPQTGRESFGVVLAEAMAAGTPVVASDLPAFRAVLGDGGLLVPPGDGDAMAGALARVLTEPGLAGRLSEEARARVARWAWPHLAPRWEAVYDAACNGAAAGS